MGSLGKAWIRLGVRSHKGLRIGSSPQGPKDPHKHHTLLLQSAPSPGHQGCLPTRLGRIQKGREVSPKKNSLSHWSQTVIEFFVVWLEVLIKQGAGLCLCSFWQLFPEQRKELCKDLVTEEGPQTSPRTGIMPNITTATAQMLCASEHMQHPPGAGLGAHCSPEGCLQLHVEPTFKLQSLLQPGEGLRATTLTWGTLSTGSLDSLRDEEKDKLRTLSFTPTCLYNLCCSRNQCHHFHPAMGLGAESQTPHTQHYSGTQGHPGKVPGRNALTAGVPHPITPSMLAEGRQCVHTQHLTGLGLHILDCTSYPGHFLPFPQLTTTKKKSLKPLQENQST